MENTVSIEIPSTIFYATHMTAQDFKIELALALFAQNKLSFGKARELTNLSVWDFQDLLGRRSIPIHYDHFEYEKDLQVLKNADVV